MVQAQEYEWAVVIITRESSGAKTLPNQCIFPELQGIAPKEKHRISQNLCKSAILCSQLKDISSYFKNCCISGHSLQPENPFRTAG
ncbi:MAG: hypothetical protein D6B25_03190 [Desulfobulbaceae bacterium]|nr:MAG: hypothetical protein D6B25_03190 [Desulfobulbaceae bacterium]